MPQQTTTANAKDVSDPFDLRQPRASDADGIWQLVQNTGVLDVNSRYAYLLLTTHFAETCVVAAGQGGVCGFLTAYFPPSRPGALFVWQIAVSEHVRGQGLGKRLLLHLLRRPVANAADRIEATVAPSNLASRKLFASLAADLGVPLREAEGFKPCDFGSENHEEERLILIGPLEKKNGHV